MHGGRGHHPRPDVFFEAAESNAVRRAEGFATRRTCPIWPPSSHASSPWTRAWGMSARILFLLVQQHLTHKVAYPCVRSDNSSEPPALRLVAFEHVVYIRGCIYPWPNVEKAPDVFFPTLLLHCYPFALLSCPQSDCRTSRVGISIAAISPIGC